MNVKTSIQHALINYNSGDFLQAKHFCKKVLKASPDNIDILNLMGVIHYELRDFDSAITYFKKAVALKPDFTDALFNLGNAYREKNVFDKALLYYEKALQLQPSNAGAYNNLGVVYQNRNEPDKAISCYQKALGIDPGFADAYYNLGNVLREKKSFNEAIENYQNAIKMRPNFPGAYNNLGSIFLDRQEFDKAVECYERLLASDPNNSGAFINLGSIFQALGKYDEAIQFYSKALDISPNSAIPYNNLGSIFKEKGILDQAEHFFKQAVQADPDNPVYSENLLFQMLYNDRYDSREILQVHREFAHKYADRFTSGITSCRNSKISSRRLKIGYLSPDFRKHAVAYFIEPILTAHSREHFEVYCYSNALLHDGVTNRLSEHADVWRDITGMSDEEAAELIRQDKIDILVDLAGHTANNRMLVFARKPAPVQVNWIGYPFTTGLSAMDYKIGDNYTDPPGRTEQFYTEKIIRLPDSFLCYLPNSDSPDVGELPAIRNRFITFGTLNNFTKITPRVFALWARILGMLPDSRMLIKGKGFSDETMCRYAETMFGQLGISAERIILQPWEPSPKHLESYNMIDIGLDTFPFNGITTTCEALWMGVPVITLEGEAYASRGGVSLLSNVGHAELIAQTDDEYVTLAVGLAADVNRLQSIRLSLRERMARSPLCDTGRFILHLENCYRGIWKNWCDAQ
jgi:protein O-GlcNAc transferase